MTMHHFKKPFLFLALLMGASQISFAACDQTLSPGANVASAISSAAGGTTICLNSGSYGSVNLSNIVKTSDVTVQSVSGNSAVASLIVRGSNHLRFKNLTISGMDMNATGNKNISIVNNTFKGQLKVIGSGSSSTPANILIDGNTFDGISVCSSCSEGRLQLYDAGGVTVSNNHFGGAGESDGIQWGGYGGTVGPGNVFDGIIQGSYSRHIDAIQLYGQVDHHTIIGNYFMNGDTYIMAPDGGNAVTFKNNVAKAGSGSYYWKFQFGSHSNLTFSHNTIPANIGVSIDKKSDSTIKSSNAVVQNNIMTNGAGFKTKDSSGVESCTNCTFSHNLFSSNSQAIGTNNLVGAPTFIGGTSPTTWAGYQLTSNSLGYRAATDGSDMGTTYYGTGTPSTGVVLNAPTNLRVN